MDMSSALKSINTNKANLLRDKDGQIIDQEIKKYPAFIVNRALSYHSDAVFFVAFMFEKHINDPAMQYEFLLHVLPKASRFAKWAKPQQSKLLDIIMEDYNVNNEVAKGYIRLMTPEQQKSILNARGGRNT